MNECPYSDAKEDLLRRLKKVEGQVKGIQRMVENDKYCVDVLVQVAAVRAAVNKVGTMIFEYHSRGCLKKRVGMKRIKTLRLKTSLGYSQNS